LTSSLLAALLLLGLMQTVLGRAGWDTWSKQTSQRSQHAGVSGGGTIDVTEMLAAEGGGRLLQAAAHQEQGLNCCMEPGRIRNQMQCTSLDTWLMYINVHPKCRAFPAHHPKHT
jgi:hypothetical protein